MWAAGAFRRLSHGLLFAGGGARRLDDFKRDAAGYFDDFNQAEAESAEGLNALEQAIYARAIRPGARLCVIGCGTGRDLLPFAAAGHDVVGIEPASGPVASLRAALARRGTAAQVIQGFIEDVELPGTFDAMLLSPHCYSYIPGSARRVEVLRKLRAHLNPGGCIAINFLRRTGSWSGRGVRIAGAVATATGSDCPWEPHDVVQLFDTVRGPAIIFEHYFLPDEVRAEADAAELRVIDAAVDNFLGAITVVG